MSKQMIGSHGVRWTSTAAGLALALGAGQAQATWVMIDDFEDGAFTVGQSVEFVNGWRVPDVDNEDLPPKVTVALDPHDSSNQVLHFYTGGTNVNLSASKPLPEIAAADSVTTLFFRAMYGNDAGTGLAFTGLADRIQNVSGVPRVRSDQGASVALVRPSYGGQEIRLAEHSNQMRTADQSHTTLQWHNFWIVADNPAGTYRVYMTQEDRDVTEADLLTFEGRSDFAFDRPEDLEWEFVQLFGWQVEAELYLDDVHVSYSENLSFIPEPASLALLGLGGLAMLSHRRRA